jgi:2-polyprenyl-6-methoxyphenol hydroxylase-like FAD-dependent oxidoreductase
MLKSNSQGKVVIIGAGPVGALAALYAARRGDDVEVYELRGGESCIMMRQNISCFVIHACSNVAVGKDRIRIVFEDILEITC